MGGWADVSGTRNGADASDTAACGLKAKGPANVTSPDDMTDGVMIAVQRLQCRNHCILVEFT